MLGSLESKVKSASSARERERSKLCSSRRASIAIGWEPQSYLLLLSFLSLIIAPSGPPIIFTLWLGMQGFALDRLDGKKLRAQPHTSSRESFSKGRNRKNYIVRMKLIGTANNNSWEIDSLKRSHSKWMVHVETHTHTFSFFGGKWFPCSILGLLTRRIPHSIGLLCLITVTIFSVGVCLVLFFRWKLPGTSERVDRKTKVMAVLTCLLHNTQTNTHIQPRDFKPPDCSHTHRLDPTLRLAHHSSSDLHPTFCCVYFALYLNSFSFKEEEGTYVFFFFSLFARIEFPTFLIFFYFSRKKNVCLCVVHVPI